MFKSLAETGVGTTKTTIGTVPTAKSWTILGLSCANVATEEAGATVYLFKSATTTEAKLGDELAVPVSSSLLVVADGQKVIAEAGDEIRVESTVASSLDVVLSYLESDV
jgi:hypothetical protein